MSSSALSRDLVWSQPRGEQEGQRERKLES